MAAPPVGRAGAGWRRFDSLGLRLFLLMWVVLVASHLAAWWLAAPTHAPGGSPPLPTLPSLPPGGPLGPADAAPPGPGGPPGVSPQPAPPTGGTRPGSPPPPPRGGEPAGLPTPALWLDYAVRLLVIALGAALGARWLARPMARLSRAAGQLAKGLRPSQAPPRLDERRGTREVRETARVFNHMAERLQQQFDARGLQMAAVSHDLRTPLTRLRMRLEALDGPLADAAVRDIREMDQLIDDTLAVLREQREGAPPSVVDLVALVQAVVDDLADQGHAVALGGMPQARARAHPAALRRIVDNLLANALRHGHRAWVTIAPVEGGVELAIDDDGPGIPPAQIEPAFQPWVRLEGSPTPGGGQGLGLAIARDLAERSGARLTLENREEGGLRARLLLPPA